MTRRRIYRHDIRCPECGSNWTRQNGFTNALDTRRRPRRRNLRNTTSR